ncbi:MAG: hypothetical protein ACRCVJ_11800 [Clostridium sp.]
MKTILVTLQAKEEYMLKDVLEELRYHEYIQDGSVQVRTVKELEHED